MTNIADAIRSKLNTTATYTPGEMSSAINLITTPITLQNKSITPTKLTQSVTADNGYNGLGTVTINPIPNNYIEPTGTININSNGTVDVTQYASANVSVSGQTINLQGNKTVSSSETDQTISPDSGYNGFSSITITGLGTTYVGSGISRRTSSNLSTNGATVIALPGYYSATASKAIASVTQATPTISVNSSTGLITASVIQSAGYVSAGTKSATSQMTVKAATTYTPTTVNQTIAAGTYLTGIQTIKGDSNLVAGNIKSGISIFGVAGSYSGSGGITPTGTISVTANGAYDVTNYATADVNISPNLQAKSNITPTESSQTINPDTNYDGLSSVQINAISTTYVGSGIARKTSADVMFASSGNLLDPNSTVINAYTASASGKLTSSSPDRAVIVPVAINSEYTFTWNRVALTSDSDDFSIGIFKTYPAINSIGRWVGASLATSGSVSRTFTTTNNEHYIAIKIAHNTKTDFTQTLANSTLYITNENVVSVPSGYYANGASVGIPTETKSITTNGTFTPSTGKLISSVTVNVPTGGTINNQSKTVDPSSSQISVTPDSGYTGLSEVIITAIPNDYIGSAITERTSTDVTVNGAAVTIPSGYYVSNVTKSVASGTAGTPTATKGTVSNHSISVTPSVTNTTGYIIGGAKTGTAVTVLASELVSGNKEITANGTNIDVTNYATVSVSVSSQAPTYQAKTNITPTTASQTITPDSGYDALSSVQINAIPSNYKNTSDANATAANVLSGKIAYNSSGKITGTMANNGATGGTITTQNGTYTIPAGYTSGGTVTATFAAGSTTAANISGAAFEETTGDYGFRASVQIQPGYYASATTVTKDFSTILPAPSTEGTSAQVLAGYDLYNHEGQVISGSMTNNSIGTITLDQTTTSYTIPAGYHNGTGKVQHTTVNIPDPTISVNTATGVITASGSWTRGFTTDNSYSKTYNLTVKAATTYTPTTANQTIAANTYLTGIQTIKGDSNLVAGNIKSGVSIFGVSGSYSGLNTSDADATAADINNGKTAYVNGVKITGSQVINKFYTGSSAPSSSLGNNGDIYLQE